ncbi:MAG: M28 family peptidase [Clostridiales bacterium]|nr:M28 family peptidase [Clostridiales bacterium]
MNVKERYTKCINTSYAYHLAKKMESFKSNEVLGYRTAGSKAEYLTGEMLYQEMKAIGLSNVTKDKILLDSWEFTKAKLQVTTKDKITYHFELGSYQTQFVTNGPEKFDLVYVKKGTANDYKKLDVKGKLVLVDINQRDEWWINYPVYQAYLKGAAALIAVQEGGYGEVNERTLNAQDIAGPSYAPAFSMSRADAEVLKTELRRQKSISVRFEASSVVREKQPSYNIVGQIPGRNYKSADGTTSQKSEEMILVSAHYDSYFNGFQDDNAAVAMMLSIAKSLLESGYKPQKTLVFCAMAAEEWGITNSKFDWSTGAYQQVFYVHPEWRGKVVVDFNFELPAMAHGSLDKICSVYEYKDFLRSKTKNLSVPESIYPDGLEVVAPVKTWSDDFSIAISGIPSMVNDFSDSKFMETHYHSQFDNEKFYQEGVYQFHHELYGKLLIDYDQALLPPLNFATLFAKMVIPAKKDQHLGASKEIKRLNQTLLQAKENSHILYKQICKINSNYLKRLEETQKSLEGDAKDPITLEEILEHERITSNLLAIFQMEQDSFVRLNWHDDVKFPHEIIIQNLIQVTKAIEKLKNKDIKGAMTAIYHIDNNRYAFLFEREVFEYFTHYVLDQPKERLQWGAGRIIAHEDLFDLVESLKAKSKKNRVSYHQEIEQLMEVKQRQMRRLREILISEEEAVTRINTQIRKVLLWNGRKVEN